MIRTNTSIHGASVTVHALMETAAVAFEYRDEHTTTSVVVDAEAAVRLYRKLSRALGELTEARKLPAPQGHRPVTWAEDAAMSKDGA